MAAPSSARPPRDLSAWAARAAAVAAVAAIWQLLPDSVVPVYAVGRPIAIAGELWRLIAIGEISSQGTSTTLNVAAGLAIGAPIGIGLAVASWFRPVGWVLAPMITLTNATPKVGLLTLYVLLLGIGDPSHVALVVSFVTFVFFFNTQQALRELDQPTLVALELLGASRLSLIWKFVLPSAVPHLLAAFRVAAPLAYASEVFAEIQIPAYRGLGGLLAKYSTALNAEASMAVLVLVALVGYLLDMVILARLKRYTEMTGTGGMRL